MESILSLVDGRIAKLVSRLATDKLDLVCIHAEDLVLLKGKSPERALADALESFKLV